VISKGGFTRVRRATETPFNMILEARPQQANLRCQQPAFRDLQILAFPLGQQGSSRHVIGRSWPRCPSVHFHRDDGSAHLLGSDVARHFREVVPLGNRLAVVYGSPHTFARQVGDVSHRVLVGVAIRGELSDGAGYP
jgi:hypothetical protein